jgi:hypothetical protein
VHVCKRIVNTMKSKSESFFDFKATTNKTKKRLDKKKTKELKKKTKKKNPIQDLETTMKNIFDPSNPLIHAEKEKNKDQVVEQCSSSNYVNEDPFCNYMYIGNVKKRPLLPMSSTIPMAELVKLAKEAKKANNESLPIYKRSTLLWFQNDNGC